MIYSIYFIYFIFLIYSISFNCFCRTVQYFPYRQAYPFSLSLSLSHSHSHAPFVKCCRACFAICRTVAFGIYTKRRRRTRRTRRTRSETYSNGLRIFIFDCHLILTETETRLRFICFTILNLIVCFYFDSALSLFSLLFFFLLLFVLFCVLFCRRVSHSDAPNGRSLPQLVLSLTKRR